jgi:hypothetical protein
MKAYSMVRHDPHYRREAFAAGLTACGYEVHGPPRDTPRPDDVLLIWNRYGPWERAAAAFDRVGAAVICCENGVLGRDFKTRHGWYSIARDIPAAQGGAFPIGGPERWAGWGVTFCEWRNGGREVIVLAQRGIGPAGVAEPPGWHRRVYEKLKASQPRPVRIRAHPGENAAIPLERDLENAFCCVTWGSGAGLKALIYGVPVFFGNPGWIGRTAAQPLGASIEYPWRHERALTFERLAWSTWNIEEIATGLPFRRLLHP